MRVRLSHNVRLTDIDICNLLIVLQDKIDIVTRDHSLDSAKEYQDLRDKICNGFTESKALLGDAPIVELHYTHQ